MSMLGVLWLLSDIFSMLDQYYEWFLLFAGDGQLTQAYLFLFEYSNLFYRFNGSSPRTSNFDPIL